MALLPVVPRAPANQSAGGVVLHANGSIDALAMFVPAVIGTVAMATGFAKLKVVGTPSDTTSNRSYASEGSVTIPTRIQFLAHLVYVYFYSRAVL